MSNLQFSVVVGTYNPRLDYLERVLAALDAQTFDRANWELIVVDNRSEQPLEGRLTASSWYRVVREETPGVIAVRHRGMIETSGNWFVYVDDDNVLKSNYLQELHQLTLDHPHVAVWNAEIEPEFEIQPPPQTKPFWMYLAIRKVTRTQWSNISASAPGACGAGMAVRRDVMTQWAAEIKTDAARSRLGRKKNSLQAGDDTDIGFTACDMGLGVGESNALRLVHLIPSRRTRMIYLWKIACAVTYSHILLNLARQRVALPGLFLRALYCTRELVSSNRTFYGVALWSAQISGIVSAWINFTFRSKSS